MDQGIHVQDHQEQHNHIPDCNEDAQMAQLFQELADLVAYNIKAQIMR